jgi:hypothetical protein
LAGAAPKTFFNGKAGMNLLVLAVHLSWGAILSAPAVDSDNGLELRTTPVTSLAGGKVKVSLRWSKIPNPWLLKRTEIVHVGVTNRNLKETAREVKLTSEFVNMRQEVVEFQFELPEGTKLGEVVWIQFGGMRVCSLVVP